MSPDRTSARPRDPRGTRSRLLEAAFREIHRRGFQAARLEAILQRARVTKGALYHHFGSKRGLGEAVIEEIVRPRILEQWLRPLEEAADPLAALDELARWGEREVTPEQLALGCPLNNLGQELAALDEGLRRRLSAILDEWRGGVAAALARAQRRGVVRDDLDTDESATLIVALWEGAIGLAKIARDRSALGACRRQLADYLESLRPGVSVTPGETKETTQA